MQIVLRVKDDGTAVIEKFGKTAEKEGEKVSTNWGKVGAAVGLAAAAAASAAAVMIKSSIDTADATGKVADKLGMTTEAFSALAYSAKATADITRDNFGQAMRMMVDNLSQAAQGTGLAKNAIADLGLNAKQLADMGPEKAILAISDALEKIPNQGDRVRIAMDVFRNADMVNALRGGSAALRQMMSEAKLFGQVISEKTAREADLFNDNLDRMKSIATGAAAAMTASLLPTLVELTGKFLAAYEAGGLLHAALTAIGSSSIQQRIVVITSEIDLLKKEMQAAGEGWATLTRDDENFGGELEERLQEKIERLERERKLLEAEAIKIQEASAIKPPAGAAGGGGLGAQQTEELLKQYQDVHARMIGEQQKLVETYVKDYTVFKTMLDNKMMSLTQFQEETKRLAEIYEIDLAEIQKPNPTLFDQYVTQLTNQSIALAESLETKEQIELEDYDRRFAMIDEMELREIEIGMSYDALREQLMAQHTKRMYDIEVGGMSAAAQTQASINKQRSAMWQAAWGGDVASLAGVFGEVSTLMTSSSKIQFEIGKKAALAQAVLSGTLAVVNGLATTPFFPLGIIMGAVALAASIKNINKIKGMQFQGGASPGGALPTYSANPGTGLPQAPGSASGLPSDGLPPPPNSAAAAAGPRNVTVNIKSDSGMVSMEWVRDRLIPGLNEAVGDGVRLQTT